MAEQIKKIKKSPLTATERKRDFDRRMKFSDEKTGVGYVGKQTRWSMELYATRKEQERIAEIKKEESEEEVAEIPQNILLSVLLQYFPSSEQSENIKEYCSDNLISVPHLMDLIYDQFENSGDPLAKFKLPLLNSGEWLLFLADLAVIFSENPKIDSKLSYLVHDRISDLFRHS